MKMRHVLIAAAMLMATASPLYARDLSCAEWLAYRTGDKSLAGQGLLFTTFLQGYIDGVNEFSDLFNGNLITETSPGKFAPTPPARHLTIENSVGIGSAMHSKPRSERSCCRHKRSKTECALMSRPGVAGF
jgi:hypothetical protein